MLEYYSPLNLLEWVALFLAFAISARSPNIRWLTGTLIVFKSFDLLTISIILSWGGFYYVFISIMDLIVILLILKRQKTATALSGVNFKFIQHLARRSAEYYKLTSNEIGIILLYMLSISVNLASLVERAIRKYTQFDPMFVYNNFAMSKFVITTLITLILYSVAIDGARNLYLDRKRPNTG
ncbi:hypothetical protein FLM48_03250 [Shewanella sp. Scap07]|uniref:hypothetical protein n=1 Tax=Shewanella sp. Scap07 TaxID=2589987 RepID=UPI0015C15A7F|nr:hypothetical protein [Shewanella sp. Scap07]QLE84184.1 hypothetical protein FLM48_03250 [Shewanella sp. Scap07]